MGTIRHNLMMSSAGPNCGIVQYENKPTQQTSAKFQLKNLIIFLIFSQNIDCVYTLEPPCRGGSNEYPHVMFWINNKKQEKI